MINSIPLCFFAKDADDDFRYVLCNQTFAAFVGRTPEEVIGKTDVELFSQPWDAEGLRAADRRIINQPDGEEVDHLDDWLRADGQWLYYGVEEENFFLIQWYPDEVSANAKLAQLEELGDGKQYLVDLTLKRENPSQAENFGNSNPVQLRS